eukprot:10305824-Ditylum_brightwellii.AAC.1
MEVKIDCDNTGELITSKVKHCSLKATQYMTEFKLSIVICKYQTKKYHYYALDLLVINICQISLRL